MSFGIKVIVKKMFYYQDRMLLLFTLELDLVLVDSCCLHCVEELLGCQAGCYEDWVSLNSVIFDLNVEIDSSFLISFF